MALLMLALGGCVSAPPGEPQARSNWEFSKDGEGRDVMRFYSDSGPLVHEWRHLDGKMDGPQKDYYPNGALKSYTHWEMGKLNGQSWWWHENGTVAGVRGYLNNEEHGTTRLWYEDGTLAVKEEWGHGVKHGTCFWRAEPWPSPMMFVEEKWQTGILREKRIVELPNEPPPEFMEQD